MSDADPTPNAQARVRATLVRTLAGAVGVVVLVAAAFWGVGQLTGQGTPTVAGPGDDAAQDDAGADVDEGADQDDGTAQDDAGEQPGDPATDGEDVDVPPTGEDDASSDTDAAGGSTDAGGVDAGDADADGPDADGVDADGTGGSDVDRAIAPGSVSLQVLDGVKTDGGTAADEVAGVLEGAGYRVVARNDALDYEVTTVLYNPGNEAAAEQVAAELDGAEVRAQPGNLSSEVDLHVVVGRDRA